MMRNTVLKSQTIAQRCCTALSIFAMALATGGLPAVAQPAPIVPAELQVPAGNRRVLTSRAIGTQNYICLPNATGAAWTFIGPQATLFDRAGRQTATHYLSPNPTENGTSRPAWQDSDGSTVWGMVAASVNNPQIVAPGAIPWLLVKIVGTQNQTIGRPTANGSFSRTTFIQRLNTTGGIAPTTGCTTATDVGKRSFVPYTTDYAFHEAIRSNGYSR